MKKLFFLFAFILAPVLLFAQDPEIPADVGDLLANLGTFLGTLTGFAGATIFIAAIIIKAINMDKQWTKLVTGFVTAILLSILSNVLNFGLFAESAWLDTLLWGVGLGFIAGSLVDIPTTKVLIELVLSLIRFKKPV